MQLFMFGVLKFFNPFKGWYSVQVVNSGLNPVSYAMGIIGEITVGTSLIFSLIFKKKIPLKVFSVIIALASFIAIIMMLTGIYVHLQPNVPASVLPLKIKPPYIPSFFLLLALVNIILSIKQFKKNRQRSSFVENNLIHLLAAITRHDETANRHN